MATSIAPEIFGMEDVKKALLLLIGKISVKKFILVYSWRNNS